MRNRIILELPSRLPRKRVIFSIACDLELSPCTATSSSVTTRHHFAYTGCPFLLRPPCLSSHILSLPFLLIRSRIRGRGRVPTCHLHFHLHTTALLIEFINQLTHNSINTVTIPSTTSTSAFFWRHSSRQMNLHPRYIQLISSHPSKLKGTDIT